MSYSLYAVLAGDDQIADVAGGKNALNSIPSELLTLIAMGKNFHENFNEVNREETFRGISKWLPKIIS